MRDKPRSQSANSGLLNQQQEPEPTEGKVMPASYDPYHDKKLYHWARFIDPKGRISPWCAKTPRALDLHRELWTQVESAVTCEKCIAARRGAL